MNSNKFAAMALAAVCGTLVVPRSMASVTWDGWVNGFGWSKIKYKLVCRNGQVIERESTDSSGTDTCDDGSNSISWNYGAFWKKDTRGNDRKAVVASSCHTTTEAQLLDGGRAMFVQGFHECDGAIDTQIAVLLVPGDALPSEGPPRSVQDLLNEGYLSPERIVHVWEFFGPGSQPFEGFFQLPGEFNHENVILYEFSASARCAADFDGDGFITGIDYDLFVAAFEHGDDAADFDGDGFITGIDFDLYVAAFEAGCE